MLPSTTLTVHSQSLATSQREDRLRRGKGGRHEVRRGFFQGHIQFHPRRWNEMGLFSNMFILRLSSSTVSPAKIDHCALCAFPIGTAVQHTEDLNFSWISPGFRSSKVCPTAAALFFRGFSWRPPDSPCRNTVPWTPEGIAEEEEEKTVTSS